MYLYNVLFTVFVLLFFVLSTISTFGQVSRCRPELEVPLLDNLGSLAIRPVKRHDDRDDQELSDD